MTTRSNGAGTADRRSGGREIGVANAPCSWGTIEGFGSDVPYDRMLDELVATGYAGTELGDYGYMPTDPTALAEELRSRDLIMLGAFQGVDLRRPDALEDARPRLVALAELLAGVQDPARPPYLILADDNGRDPVRRSHAGRITPDLGLSEEEWRSFARNAEDVARLVRDVAGLRTLFHPHCAGFVETPDETARLLELTDPALVNIVFDTGHYVYGSGEPDPDGHSALRGLERFWGRVPYVHFKDCHPAVARDARRKGLDYGAAVRRGVFCELGEGSVDFAAVVSFLRSHGYDDWITVEQDVLPGMGTPKESARRNRQYLAALGL